MVKTNVFRFKMKMLLVLLVAMKFDGIPKRKLLGTLGRLGGVFAFKRV
jgi:hypothetical protein